jgi:hypothetical protein
MASKRKLPMTHSYTLTPSKDPKDYVNLPFHCIVTLLIWEVLKTQLDTISSRTIKSKFFIRNDREIMKTPARSLHSSKTTHYFLPPLSPAVRVHRYRNKLLHGDRKATKFQMSGMYCKAEKCIQHYTLMRVSGQRHIPVALTPRNTLTSYHTGGWVGQRAGLDGCAKFCSYWDSIPVRRGIMNVN